MKTLAIIPMRSGSKGIPNKNMITFCGKALCRWTIDQAQNSSLSGKGNRIIVSTDSDEYKEKLDLWYPGIVPWLRPEKYAKDKTPSSDVILHALDECPGYDTVMLLEPTAPIRCAGDIDAALDLFIERKAKALISVAEDHRTHPAISFEMSRDGRVLPSNTGGSDVPHMRRQDMSRVYHPTGTIYIANVDWYKRHETFITGDTIGYKVNPFQDHEIDEPHDLLICGALMDLVK